MRVVRAAADPILMSQVAVQLGSDLRDYARDLLGVTELDQRVKQLMPAPAEVVESNGKAPEDVSLRVKGALLLRAAAELDEHDGTHPAYARILTELAPDEGRILRLLATARRAALGRRAGHAPVRDQRRPDRRRPEHDRRPGRLPATTIRCRPISTTSSAWA